MIATLNSKKIRRIQLTAKRSAHSFRNGRIDNNAIEIPGEKYRSSNKGVEISVIAHAMRKIITHIGPCPIRNVNNPKRTPGIYTGSTHNLYSIKTNMQIILYENISW